MRDLAIFNLAIDSFAPVTSLNYDWTTSALKQNVRRATIVQMKKGRPVQFEITEQSRGSVEAGLPMLRTTGSRYLDPECDGIALAL